MGPLTCHFAVRRCRVLKKFRSHTLTVLTLIAVRLKAYKNNTTFTFNYFFVLDGMLKHFVLILNYKVIV
jgi:hypothetical protein